MYIYFNQDCVWRNSDTTIVGMFFCELRANLSELSGEWHSMNAEDQIWFWGIKIERSRIDCVWESACVGRIYKYNNYRHLLRDRRGLFTVSLCDVYDGGLASAGWMSSRPLEQIYRECRIIRILKWIYTIKNTQNAYSITRSIRVCCV